jgi:hypothetical protein
MPNPNFFATGQDAPIVETLAIIPNDATDLGVTPRALWIGIGGDVAVMAAGDAAASVLKNVSAGYLLPVRAKRVMATNTTAQNIVALY